MNRSIRGVGNRETEARDDMTMGTGESEGTAIGIEGSGRRRSTAARRGVGTTTAVTVTEGVGARQIGG